MKEALRRFGLGLLYTVLWTCSVVSVGAIFHWLGCCPQRTATGIFILVILVFIGRYLKSPLVSFITIEIPVVAFAAISIAKGEILVQDNWVYYMLGSLMLCDMTVRDTTHVDFKTKWERTIWMTFASLASGYSLLHLDTIPCWIPGAALVITIVFALIEISGRIADGGT